MRLLAAIAALCLLPIPAMAQEAFVLENDPTVARLMYLKGVAEWRDRGRDLQQKKKWKERGVELLEKKEWSDQGEKLKHEAEKQAWKESATPLLGIASLSQFDGPVDTSVLDMYADPESFRYVQRRMALESLLKGDPSLYIKMITPKKLESDK